MAAELTLKRAVLGAGGVGYFEYAAEISGEDTLFWRAPLNQVDDILKSIVVMDEAGPASVTLPGKASLDTAFASLPFGVHDLSSIPALLESLKGAEISVSSPRRLSGRIVNVLSEPVTDKEGRVLTSRTRISLITDETIEQFILEDADGVKFADQTLGRQVTAALDALRANQDRSSRTIAIHLSKGQKRLVRVGMVTEAPVWKAVYRLSLPQDKNDKARLQGWAVLENMTGTDWKDVSLTLSASSPVTFRQALYDPYYVPRPTLMPPVSRAALPQRDEGQMQYEISQNVVSHEMRERASKADRMSVAKSIPQFMAEQTAAPVSDALGIEASFSQREETIAGSSFTLESLLNVKAGESITTPFIDMVLDAEQVAWIQSGSEQNRRSVWHAVTLINNDAVTLPAGAVTLYENSEDGPLFAGEAQMAVLPVGESRMLGFGLDQKITADAETSSMQVLSQMSAAKGVLTLDYKYNIKTQYRIKNASDEVRQIVLEHPRQSRFKLVNHDEIKATLTSNAYRMRVSVQPKETKTIDVILETPTTENLTIGELSEDRANGIIAAAHGNSALKEKFQPIMNATRLWNEKRLEENDLRTSRTSIAEDQRRIRDNLNAAPRGSDLEQLYSKKLLEQEKEIDNLDKKLQTARQNTVKARSDLEKAIAKLQ